MWKQCQQKNQSPTNQDSPKLEIPKWKKGTSFVEYSIDDLFQDQLDIVTVIIDKIIEWCTCKSFKKFKPLRMTINGAGGSGKTIIINLIVTILRKMFNDNEVVQVCAPTGTAAFNAGGETLHHFLHNKAGQFTYEPYSMNQSKKDFLSNKLKNLLCLIIDERSLLDSTLLGISEQMVKETIFNGQMDNKSWGNLPVLILVGDDYQLPSITPGALDCLDNIKGNKITNTGRSLFQEATQTVMSLTSSKRINKKQKDDKELIAKLRVAADLSEKEQQKLLNLHLNNIRARHGEETVEKIKDKSIYLFFRNNKRIMKNMEMLIEKTSKDNPVAICQTQSKGQFNGKGIKSHYKNSDIPTSAMLAINAKVALENRNFCPQWGLHNGAVGTVKEIVFKKGESPNKGNLPDYVVVDFPQYTGPTWDCDNPTVRKASII